ncbi:hypothetical protein G7054_g1707 [Neopestalotiopsis clavispora]|nr:hypothetical protein G7054_g1707 [Neopestalotiopsis clavispora]
MATSSSFGNANAGFQAGYIAGSVHNPTFHHHAAPEPLETAPKPTIIIPFPRDQDFVRRDIVYDQVIDAGAEPGSWVALVGLGGVGKSQIAIEYAYQIRDESPETWVFWVHASNAARYEQSFRELADLVRLPGRQNSQDNIFQLVGSWLRSDKSGKWVLILDNVDDATFLLQVQSGRQDAQGSSSRSQNNRPLWSYLPHCQQGMVLITTRRRDIALSLVESHRIVDIGPMSLEDARKLVDMKLGTLSDDEDIETAGALAQALEYIPLAIVQATSYIAQRGLRYSMQKYLKKLTRSDREKTSLLDVEGGHLRRDWEAKNSIILTWQISFDYIRQSRRSAADLLSFMSWCDRQGIPESLLQEMISTGNASEDHENHQNNDYSAQDLDNHYDSDNHEDNGSADSSVSDDSQSETSASDGLEEDIIMLRDFSFIHIIGDGKLFEMHRLVQLSMRKWLEAEGQQERWKQIFIKCLSSQIPPGRYENWTECQMYLPHAKAAAEQRPKDEASLLDWATIMYRAGWYLEQMGLGQEALKMAEDALGVRTHLLGQEDEEALWAKSLVGIVKKFLGQWGEAEQLQVEVMETRKARFGSDHLDTLTSMNDLASTYGDQGRYEEAEELQVKVVEARKAKLGLDHPHTLTSMDNLALTYGDQGRYEEAEELQMEAMEAYKAKLELDHPDLLTSMANLASTYWEQGRYKEAEELEVEVMEASKAELGLDHRDTLISMDNLAVTYSKQGRYEEAEELQLEVMEACKAKLGLNHPDTATSMHNLAYTWHDIGHKREATALMRQCLELRTLKLGPSHPDTDSSARQLTIWETNAGEGAGGEIDLGIADLSIQ